MTPRSSTTAFAKSTRPELGGVVQRENLFTRLDATASRTVAWVHAPPGFGKTTLAASYLEARSYRWAWYQVDSDDDDGESFFHYLSHAVRHVRGDGSPLPVFAADQGDLGSFARRFFRSLFKGVTGPVAIVLDNLHELSSDSPLRRILEAGLPEVPRQCSVIVTSREAPPSGLAKLLPSGQMIVVGVDQLRVSDSELDAMALLRGSQLAPESLMQIRERTEGWVAALVLMLEHHKLAESLAQLPTDTTPKVVFDYLAGEIFDRFDPGTQRLLLQIACVPRLSVAVAQGLSGDTSAGRILLNLAHNDYFVRELVGLDGRLYVLHPLLREFLLHRAARDAPAAIGPDSVRRAARLLRDSGQFEDAMALFVDCADWPEAAGIVSEHCTEMLAQGRHGLLATWLDLLPPHVLASHAGLQYAQGASLTRVSPRAARHSFEKALEAFERRNDRHGMAKCCLGVIDVLLREFDDLSAIDRWLVEFERCRTLTADGSPMPREIIIARLWRDPSHPSIALALKDRVTDVSTPLWPLLAIAAALNADFASASSVLKGASPDGLSDPVWLAGIRAVRCLLDGDAAASLQAAREGLASGAAQSIHEYDARLHTICAMAAVTLDDLETARTSLSLGEEVADRRGDRAFVHLALAGLAHAAGNPGLALREAKNAALLGVESGSPWPEALARLTMAQLLAAADDKPSTQGQLRAAEALAERMGSPLLRLSTLFVQAGTELSLDDAASSLALQQAIGLARDLGVHHVPGLQPALLGRLCALALRRGIAPEHTRLLIDTAKLAPPADALRLRQWPWAFEVTTLGSFSLHRSGEAIEFSAKGPGRPVELLKLLISLGGQQVRVEHLADTLWPHVDADYAHQSFTATLHRLRRILGGEDTLKLRDGRLSVNTALFWLDVWALDEVLTAIDTTFREHAGGAGEKPLQALLDEVFSLYRGPFLADDAEHPSYLARREQLRAKMLRSLAKAARHLEDAGRSDVAIDTYSRLIDADEQCEAFYRNLMLCYQRQGETADAMATYERLCAVLAARSRTEPAAETRAIRSSLGP